MIDVYFLVGIPGSGKSTFLKEGNINPKNIVSSDQIREMLYGDANIQGNPWGVVYSTIRAKVDNGISPIYIDATNVKRKDRVSLINFIRTCTTKEVNFHAIVFDVPKELAKKRNSQRERIVPDDVIDSMYDALRTNKPSEQEGFKTVINYEKTN